jgi:hypothetical protein
VMSASEAANITKDLVDAYNAQSPVAPPAAKPAGAGAANKAPANPAPKVH